MKHDRTEKQFMNTVMEVHHSQGYTVTPEGPEMKWKEWTWWVPRQESSKRIHVLSKEKLLYL